MRELGREGLALLDIVMPSTERYFLRRSKKQLAMDCLLIT